MNVITNPILNVRETLQAALRLNPHKQGVRSKFPGQSCKCKYSCVKGFKVFQLYLSAKSSWSCRCLIYTVDSIRAGCQKTPITWQVSLIKHEDISVASNHCGLPSTTVLRGILIPQPIPHEDYTQRLVAGDASPYSLLPLRSRHLSLWGPFCRPQNCCLPCDHLLF